MPEVLRAPGRVDEVEEAALGQAGADRRVEPLLQLPELVGGPRVLEVEDVIEDDPVEARADDRASDAERLDARILRDGRAVDRDRCLVPRVLLVRALPKVREDLVEALVPLDVGLDRSDELLPLLRGVRDESEPQRRVAPEEPEDAPDRLLGLPVLYGSPEHGPLVCVEEGLPLDMVRRVPEPLPGLLVRDDVLDERRSGAPTAPEE